ncbi:LAMI_0D12288g1_1 [Lachancea mirantina]|uniref:LAMI_0D12288g1_1 n=1 Tax=Lachancea mirantina TaxID=1230905 RepID=A0A1G4JFJ7_9SACH|nr:LAMI_0D12288g1_1 [Lachancea mirantina]
MTAPKSAVSGVNGHVNKNPSSWDPQDDLLLRHLKEVKKLGWKEIAQFFKNRTPNACQFRWRRLKSGNLKTTKSASVGAEGSLGEENGAVAVAERGLGGLGVESAAGDVGNVAVTGRSVSESATESYLAASTVPAAPAAPAGPALAAATTAATAIPIPRNTHGVDWRHPHQLPSLTQSLGNQMSRGSPYGSPVPPTSQQPQHLPGPFNGTAVAPGKFLKPRSFSHTVIPEKPRSDEENLGLIPKVVVRSRRGSLAQPVAPHAVLPLNHTNSHSNLSLALSTSLTGSKSRKNSFSSRSRRSSFNMAPPDRLHGPISRRESVVQAPASVATLSRRESFNSTTSRRGSMIQFRRDSPGLIPSDRRGSVSQFTDVPKGHSQHFAPMNGTSLNQTSHPTPSVGEHAKSTEPWSLDEDRLLNQRREKDLSMDELSILLPHRSEQEIQWRITALDRATPFSTSASPLHSPERSLTEDTAIEEDDQTHAQAQVTSGSQFSDDKDHSPAISSSSESHDREQSPVFSPHYDNKGQSPITADPSMGNTDKVDRDNDFRYLGPTRTQHDSGHPLHAANRRIVLPSHNTSLPSLNNLFKNVL